jgi:hypothetical protein
MGRGVWTLAAVLLAGCSSEEAPASAATKFCAGVCRGLGRCEVSAADCETRCKESDYASTLSDNGAEAFGDCVSKLPCDALYSGAGDGWGQCWRDTADHLAPTPKVRAFCAQYAEAWFQCGAWYSTTDCEHDYGMWSDSMLDRLLTCISADTCADLRACLDQVTGAP